MRDFSSAVEPTNNNKNPQILTKKLKCKDSSNTNRFYLISQTLVTFKKVESFLPYLGSHCLLRWQWALLVPLSIYTPDHYFHSSIPHALNILPVWSWLSDQDLSKPKHVPWQLLLFVTGFWIFMTGCVVHLFIHSFTYPFTQYIFIVLSEKQSQGNWSPFLKGGDGNKSMPQELWER